MDLTNKVALVTGGSKGIGFAIAERLLEAGAGVFITARTVESVEKALGRLTSKGRAYGRDYDVRDEGQVRSMLADCERVLGGVDILVNNAGIGIMGKTVEEMRPDEFRRTLETNLFGVYYACHFAVPMMRKRGGGYIINISSLAGQNAHPKMAAYNASKFGLNGFSEALMQEVRQDDIKVSCICPGSVNTHFGGDTPSAEKAWQIQPADIGQAVIDLLAFDPRVRSTSYADG